MPHYHVTAHALARFRERFEDLAALHPIERDCVRWISNLALRAQVVGTQAGMDLMLCVKLPTKVGLQKCYFAVVPQGHHDRWNIKTVLTDAQACTNLEATAQRHDQGARSAWREQKHFNRPDLRLRESARRENRFQAA